VSDTREVPFYDRDGEHWMTVEIEVDDAGEPPSWCNSPAPRRAEGCDASSAGSTGWARTSHGRTWRSAACGGASLHRAAQRRCNVFSSPKNGHADQADASRPETSRVGCGSTDRDPLSAISDLVVPRSASTVSGSAYGIRCLTMSNAATGHRARDRSKPTASSRTRVGGDDENRASPPTTAVSRAEHGCGVFVVSGLTVPRTLSRHATCTYSCTRPPSRSRRSGRMVAPERRGVWPAGGC
jgi:hypothetical protein